MRNVVQDHLEVKLVRQIQGRLQVVWLLRRQDDWLLAVQVRQKRLKFQVALGGAPALSFSFASELDFFLS